MYIVLGRFNLGEKSAVLKDSSRSRVSSKLTGISRKMEGENMMEKRLRVFRAHSRFLLRQSEVIATYISIPGPTKRNANNVLYLLGHTSFPAYGVHESL